MAANAARQAARRLRVIRGRANAAAPAAAASALARGGQVAVKAALTERSHSEGSPTPSARGQPPAKVSGDLAKSVSRVPAGPAGGGRATVVLFSHLVYGPVHEFGPVTISSKGNYPLRNRNTGQVFGRQVTIPARPWMRPTVEKYCGSGEAGRVCMTAFAAALLK